MSHPSFMRQRGVTLIEMVFVIVILAIAATAIMDQFVTGARSYQTNESIQTAAQLAQECAEHILATRRLQGYTTAIAADCTALPSMASYTTAVSSSALATAPCATTSCTLFDVVVTHDGIERAHVIFMLGSY